MIFDAATAFHRHVLGEAASAEWYRSYVRAAGEPPEAMARILARYVAGFADLPQPAPSTLSLRWTTGGNTQVGRIVFVHADDEPFEVIARAAARLASVLYRSDVRWSAISSGREADLPHGVSVRFLPESAIGPGDPAAALHALAEIPRDDDSIARELFGARPVERGRPATLGWRERRAAEDSASGAPVPSDPEIHVAFEAPRSSVRPMSAPVDDEITDETVLPPGHTTPFGMEGTGAIADEPTPMPCSLSGLTDETSGVHDVGAPGSDAGLGAAIDDSPTPVPTGDELLDGEETLPVEVRVSHEQVRGALAAAEAKEPVSAPVVKAAANVVECEVPPKSTPKVAPKVVEAPKVETPKAAEIAPQVVETPKAVEGAPASKRTAKVGEGAAAPKGEAASKSEVAAKSEALVKSEAAVKSAAKLFERDGVAKVVEAERAAKAAAVPAATGARAAVSDRPAPMKPIPVPLPLVSPPPAAPAKEPVRVEEARPAKSRRRDAVLAACFSVGVIATTVMVILGQEPATQVPAKDAPMVAAPTNSPSSPASTASPVASSGPAVTPPAAATSPAPPESAAPIAPPSSLASAGDSAPPPANAAAKKPAPPRPSRGLVSSRCGVHSGKPCF
ncbi:MAG: hypothetical protein QM820_20420 [Minicystis sp.]